ncbi:MAG TPA: molybdopterin cofactor-binding domain-containing protein [Chitinophagaceae bacterium]|nr:molybdopterin cofactor-binding domain-containing protein [Chitinophagaceae bacterium]
MSTQNKTNRRDFIKITSLTGGGLVLGFSWFGSEAAPVVIKTGAVADLNFNSYLSIATDGTITIFSPNPELGQNVMTSFPMIVAEELDADWSKVKVLQAPLDKKFDRQLTGGSGAIPHSWKRLRTAGATAKHLLVAAAAKKWNDDVSECTTANSFVIHSKTGNKLSYGELAEEAAKMPVPADVTLKNRKDFKLIGTSVKNVENKNIITGKGIFGLDFYREGMVHAMIQRPPAFGTKIKSVDDKAAKAMPGIIDVVTFKNNVAVIGRSTWEVMKARKALKIEYEKEGNIESTADHNQLFISMLGNNDKVQVKRKDGDPETAFKNAAKVITSEYQCPFLPHNPMEPMNFFADVRADGVELIGATQTPGNARTQVSKLLNIPEDKITVTITRLGGGFGRRLQTDYVTEAAELSSIIKKPVKLIWSREDDMGGGSYRPAVRYRFEAALDATGNLIGYKLRGAAINAGNSVRENNFPSGAVDNVLIDSISHQSPITTGAWRAPITNFLAYAEQSFIDEVAHAAGKDPVQFRLDLLQKARSKPVGNINYNIDRMETVIKTAAERSGWGKKKDVSQGFSVYFSHASYVAQVADAIMKDGKPVIKKIYAVSDCGEVINKSGALQQVMGAIVDGYGHAMFGKLSFKDGKPEQNNFHQFRLIRMREIPEVDAHFIDNGIDPTGLGEPALPPTGGAVANAIFKATGIRLKQQPFIDEKLFNPA